MIYTNPHLNNNLFPTINQLKTYFRLVNDLNPNTRDPRPMMSMLQRLPQVDQFLLGLIQTRKLAVTGFDYTIKLPEEFIETETEAKQIREMKIRFKKSKISDLFSMIINGFLFGLSATKFTWENNLFGTMVVKKESYELTEVDKSFETDLIDILESQKSGKYDRTPIDPTTHLFVKFNPLDGIENNYIGSSIRTNMIYVMLKYFSRWDWAKGNEKFAQPLLWGQYRKGAAAEEIAAVVAGVESLGTDAKAVVSEDVKLNLMEAQKTGMIDTFVKFIDSINAEMSISILGQTLTTDVKDRGSFAAAKVHNFVRQDILWADLLEIERIITDQYILQDYILNYGEPRNTYPSFKFVTDEAEDYESNSRIITELKSAGIMLKKNEIYEKTGFTEPEAEDEVI